ncbi:MAG: hypothetical protein U1E67_21035 [Hyphomicrobiales bacterium]
MTEKTTFFHSAAIYRFDDRLLVVPYERTRDGVRRGMATLAIVSLEDPHEIGIKVLAMLDRCADNVPDDYSRGPAPSTAVILRETKQRSWSAFHRKALLLGVYREVGARQLEITPTRRAGGGSEDVDDKTRISGDDPKEIGRTVLAALSDAG